MRAAIKILLWLSVVWVTAAEWESARTLLRETVLAVAAMGPSDSATARFTALVLLLGSVGLVGCLIQWVTVRGDRLSSNLHGRFGMPLANVQP